MKQYEKIKKDIAECNSTMEMAGYLDGISAAAIIYCKREHPEEVYEYPFTTDDISITGMNYFLQSEVEM